PIELAPARLVKIQTASGRPANWRPPFIVRDKVRALDVAIVGGGGYPDWEKVREDDERVLTMFAAMLAESGMVENEKPRESTRGAQKGCTQGPFPIISLGNFKSKSA